MRVLVGCEYSGRVRDAFAARGHDAWSCDLLPTESPGNHLQCDVRDVLGAGWDMAILHPSCTFLTISAEWCYKDDPGKKMSPGVLFGAARRQARIEAIDFVRMLLGCGIPKIALENPVGVLSTAIRKPDQIIQPYEFGDDASKKTCLWLVGLPKLVPLPKDQQAQPRMVEHNGKMVARYANQTDGGWNKLAPSEDRWKERSLTYLGIARAMAEQWG